MAEWSWLLGSPLFQEMPASRSEGLALKLIEFTSGPQRPSPAFSSCPSRPLLLSPCKVAFLLPQWAHLKTSSPKYTLFSSTPSYERHLQEAMITREKESLLILLTPLKKRSSISILAKCQSFNIPNPDGRPGKASTTPGRGHGASGSFRWELEAVGLRFLHGFSGKGLCNEASWVL